MVFRHFRFFILFIPIVIGINTTVQPSNSVISSNSSVNEKSKNVHQKAVNNSVSHMLITEGGTIVSENTMSLKETSNPRLTSTSANGSVKPKTLLVVNNSVSDSSLMAEGGAIVSEKPNSRKQNNNTLLINMEADTLLENSSKSKGTSVARKGVHLEDAPEPEKHDNFTEVKSSLLSSTQNKTGLLKKLVKSTTLTPVAPDVKRAHKPLVLVDEALKNIVPEGTSMSTKATISKQGLNPGSHPGMVMPVVITVLVVPMFAVLGYLALKRGQEAWKNRHYKRMDFLLDGMYND